MYHSMEPSRCATLLSKHDKRDLIDHFQFYVGSCVWISGDLEKQIKSGFWLPIESSPDLILGLTRQIDEELSKGPISIGNISGLSDSLQQLAMTTANTTENLSADASNSKTELNFHGKTADDISTHSYDPASEDDVSSAFHLNLLETRTPDEIRNRIWKIVVKSLGSDFEAIADTPSSLEIFDLDSIDWRESE